jgi:hypothetical protein
MVDDPMAPQAIEYSLVDEGSFEAIPTPAGSGVRCQTCDYWERRDGTRDASPYSAIDVSARAELKRGRLLAGRLLAGAYGMLAWRREGDDRVAVGWAQFGPISRYPRALSIRDRYPELPDSPAPWVITCLQVVADQHERHATAIGLLTAVCDELDHRGITAVEAYPETVGDPWLHSAGPASVYEGAGFERPAGDQHYPVMRRDLGGSGESLEWGDLLAKARPPEDEDEGWPPPTPKGPREEDLFRPLDEKAKRPNPFGDD